MIDTVRNGQRDNNDESISRKIDLARSLRYVGKLTTLDYW